MRFGDSFVASCVESEELVVGFFFNYSSAWLGRKLASSQTDSCRNCGAVRTLG